MYSEFTTFCALSRSFFKALEYANDATGSDRSFYLGQARGVLLAMMESGIISYDAWQAWDSDQSVEDYLRNAA